MLNALWMNWKLQFSFHFEIVKNCLADTETPNRLISSFKYDFVFKCVAPYRVHTMKMLMGDTLDFYSEYQLTRARQTSNGKWQMCKFANVPFDFSVCYFFGWLVCLLNRWRWFICNQRLYNGTQNDKRDPESVCK